MSFHARAVRVAGKVLPSLCMLVQCTSAPGAATGAADPMIAPAVRAAVAVGQARVIIDLRMTPPFKPEGDLPGPAAVEAQRKAIARAQAEVLSRLSGTKFALVRQYDALPTLALLIDAGALARLEAAGDVVTQVLPDAPSFRQQ